MNGDAPGEEDREPILAFCKRAGLVAADEAPTMTLPTGGVSSDIWLLRSGDRAFCVKRALPKLRVAAEWHAPVERNLYEARWLRAAAAIEPKAVPGVIAEDAALGLFAMDYLPAEGYPLWKDQLLAGVVDPAAAAAVGGVLGRLHAGFARDPGAAAAFDTTAIFDPIRVDPYLRATAAVHPGLADRLLALADRTLRTRHTVIHGDVSPKNILLGPDSRALEGIARRIEPALSGMDVSDQSAIDARLEELDGTGDFSRLGGNAAIAVSMAALQASAAAAGTSLWALLAGNTRAVLPMPMIQIFGGGAHAARRLDLQDILMMPLCATRFDEAMAIGAEVYRHAGLLMAEAGELHGVADEGGWWPDFDSNDAALERAVTAIERAGFRPGEDVALAVDVAASELCRDGRYHLEADGAVLETTGMVSLIEAWCARYPIVSVEDPLAEDDDAGMAEITRRIGDRVQIVGDDYLVTSADRIEAAVELGSCNAVLIKPNQAGTVTRTISALQAARRRGWRTVVSARSGESEDTTIVHLAVGLGADQFKVGSFARSERMAKWNEGVRIEEAMGARAEFAARRALR